MADFEYDVAFSFHQADQGLALQLNDLLSDRFRTFIYTEQQKVLAGTDGQVSFSEVYGRKARVVVVFYRKDYGQTRYTRIEQDAIKNRGLDEGLDFTLFIPTETPPSVPVWLPRTQLYFGLQTFGLDGAAAVVEHKIGTLGGEAKEETVEDRMARFKRATELKSAQRQFLNSDVGWKAATAAYEEVLKSIRERAGPGSPFRVAEKFGETLVHGLAGGGCIHLRFHTDYSNVIENYPVKADYLSGAPSLPGFMPGFEKARTWGTDRFQYTLLGPDRMGFYDTSNPQREFSPSDLSSHLLKRYIDLSERNPPRR